MLPTWFVLPLLCRWYPGLYSYTSKRNLVRCLKKVGSLSGRYQYLGEGEYSYVESGKTELIIFNPKHKSRRMTEDIQLQVSEKTIRVAGSVRKLGVYFETSLTIEKQVNAISKVCIYEIRNIGSIRRYIRRDACKTLAHALITSRLDYDNAPLYGLPGTLIAHLQEYRILQLDAWLVPENDSI